MNIPELLISRLSILDSRFSTLDSRVSKLERLDLRDARIEFQESSRDCQLTFERYCIETTDRIFKDTDKKMPTAAVFLYMSKVFQSVKHEMLFLTLKVIGTSSGLVAI